MLYHLVVPGTPDFLRPASLEEEGFVHLSTAAQLPTTLKKWFHAHDEVRALEIDESKLSSEVRWEEVAGRTAPMPHLHGPLERSAIVRSWILEQTGGSWSGLPESEEGSE